MKKVLFLTEFSSHAPEVFKYAADIAYFFKARLVLLNAFNQPELTLLTSEEKEKLEELSHNRLVEFAETNLPEAYKELKTEFIVKTGFAFEAVQKVVAEHDIDLVIMGMTGKNNVLDKIFGSTALEVFTKVPCPVLLVPPDAKFNGIDNLVYTTNFEFRDLGAINYLKKWSAVFEATIHCLHIVEPGDNLLGAFQNKEILQETYKGHKRVSVDLVEGDFREQIEKFARRKKSDIVVMMMRKDSFITRWIKSSSVKGVARNINIPLLVIKDDVYRQTGDLAKFLELMNSIA